MQLYETRGTTAVVFPDGGCPMKRRRCSTLVAMSIASVEAQKQLDRIVALGYPDVADISAAAFRSLARPLIGALEHSDLGSNILLVPTRELVSPESLIARTSINRMAGFTTMPPRDIASFLPQDASCRRKARSICRQSAHRHVLYQSRAGCGPQAYRLR